MSLGMKGFVNYMGDHGRNSAYCLISAQEGKYEDVVGILTGPFTDEITVNYDDFISNGAADMANSAMQMVTSKTLKPDLGLKVTDFQKRVYSLDLIFFTWDDNIRNVISAYKALQKFAVAPSITAKSIYDTPPKLIIMIGSATGSTWYQKKNLYISNVSGERGPTVTTIGNPNYITASITFMESFIPTADTIDLIDDSTKVSRSYFAK